MVAKRRIAVFNDTSIGGHYGCSAVMTAINRLFQTGFAEIVYRHPVGREWRENERALTAIGSADLIIVNGEGSIHHSNLRAKQLSALGPYSRSIGKPAFLINSTLYANDRETCDDIKLFDHVWVRECSSAYELTAAGINHSICPDLSLTCEFPRARHCIPGIVLIDSVVEAAVRRLAAFAELEKSPLLGMKQSPTGECMGLPWVMAHERDLKANLQTPLFPCASFRDYAEHMGAHERLITGRFHSVCFAIAMKQPFHAFRSNTPKIEATLQDAGLSSERMLPASAPIPSPLPYSEFELQSIDAYLVQARESATKMAEAILA